MISTPPPAPALTGTTRAAALAALSQLYGSLPRVACKRLCHDSCTIVDASQLERDVLAGHGIELSDKPPRLVIEQAAASADRRIGETCPALDVFGRCSVYADRPFICRAFGAIGDPAVTGPDRFEQAGMCDHGCEPEFTISLPEVMQILARIESLSRAVTGVARAPLPGDSPRLSGMFRRDVRTERAGFLVGGDIHRHVSESVPNTAGTGAAVGAGSGVQQWPVKRGKGKRRTARGT